MQQNILVVFGGVSNENEISVITGTMAANVLKNSGCAVVPFYIAQDGSAYCSEELADISNFKEEKFNRFPKALIAGGGVYILNKKGRFKKFVKVDAALNCCHGGAGEGGAVSGLCQTAGIPLASAKIFESSLFIDKYLTKLILSSLGIKTVDYAVVKNMQELDTCPNMPQFPLIVKPVNLGSSIGVEMVENTEELKCAVESALIYDKAALIEKYIENRREINCAAYFANGQVITSECEEAFTKGDILSFEDKYQGGGKSALPADIPLDISQLIKETTKKVYTSLDMRGIVRFDYILEDDNVYLSEVNTVPGSLSYYLLSSGFKDFASVLNAVIRQAVEDDKEEKNKKLLHTGILESIKPGNIKLGSK
jgi:D-alanine-D-alanine ligase